MEKVYIGLALGSYKLPVVAGFLRRTIAEPQPDRFARLPHVGTETLEITASPTDFPSQLDLGEVKIPQTAWAYMANLDLAAEPRKPTKTCQDPPRWFQGSLRRAFTISLKEWHRRPTPATWKLIALTPRMLLRPTLASGAAGKAEFEARTRRFLKGEWEDLLRETVAAKKPRTKNNTSAPPMKQTADDTKKFCEKSSCGKYLEHVSL